MKDEKLRPGDLAFITDGPDVDKRALREIHPREVDEDDRVNRDAEVGDGVECI